MEARVPFDMVHDLLLDEERLSRYRVLILSNIAALSDRRCKATGGLCSIAVPASQQPMRLHSMTNGARRKDFGLAALFGISFDGSIDTQLHNSYLNVEKNPRDGSYQPLVAGLEDATRIVNGVDWVHVPATVPQPYSPLTLVPSYPELPMEAKGAWSISPSISTGRSGMFSPPTTARC